MTCVTPDDDVKTVCSSFPPLHPCPDAFPSQKNQETITSCICILFRCFPLSPAINQNLFAWMRPCCSGSLTTVCPCVPSGACILGEEGDGFASVAYFYAKQIVPHRVCARPRTLRRRTQAREEKWDREMALKGGHISVFASCEVATEPADNNISDIRMPANGASSDNGSLIMGGSFSQDGLYCQVPTKSSRRGNLNASRRPEHNPVSPQANTRL